MLVSDKIRRAYHLMGFKEKGSIQIRPIMVNTLCITLCLNTFTSIIVGTKNATDDGDISHGIINRLLAAKDVNVLLTLFGFSMEYMFVNGNLMTLLEIIDKSFSKYRSEFEENQYDMIIERKTNQSDLLNKTSVLLSIIVFTLIFLPALVTIYLLYLNGISNIQVRDLPLPIVFWYPEGYDVIQVYILAYILQATYLLNLLGHIFCMYGSVISSLQSLCIDIELLCMDIDDIDIMVSRFQNVNDMVLRSYMKYLVKCHQTLIRNVRVFNSCVSIITTLGNQCICFQVCIFLYCITEVDNKFAKFGYFAIAFSEASVLFIYCFNGQKIINGNDELRRHLYHCPWLDKPMWLKKDLITMMSMVNTPLQVKPLGLYVLNLNNFTNIMNAAYSYFNMLRKMKTLQK